MYQVGKLEEVVLIIEEKRKAWLEERDKIKAYGEEINEETRNKNK